MERFEVMAGDRIEAEATGLPLPLCVLPDSDVQRFLLEVIDQVAIPGKMAAFVVGVQAVLKSAELRA